MVTWAAQAAAKRRGSPHSPGWHHREGSTAATFRTLFLTMDSTANTCSPIADSSISARPSVRPSLRGPTVLSPSNPSERWRFTSAVLRRRRPHYFPGRLGSHGPGDTSSCLSSCPLWLYKICDTSARRAARTPRARLPWNSPCAPPTASSLPLLCGWIQKLRNHSGSQKQNCFMFSKE